MNVNKMQETNQKKLTGGTKRGSKGNVDKEFINRISKLIKVVIPSWRT